MSLIISRPLQIWVCVKKLVFQQNFSYSFNSEQILFRSAAFLSSVKGLLPLLLGIKWLFSGVAMSTEQTLWALRYTTKKQTPGYKSQSGKWPKEDTGKALIVWSNFKIRIASKSLERISVFILSLKIITFSYIIRIFFNFFFDVPVCWSVVQFFI